MHCPACNKPLHTIKSKGYELDVCLHCKGIWFDNGEMLGFAKELSENAESADKWTLFNPRKAVGQNDLPSKRTCPRCQAPMKQFNYAYDSNIFLDRCTGCQGIWTDDGEIQRVAVHLKSDPRIHSIGGGLIREQQIQEVGGLSNAIHAPSSLLFAPRIILPIYDDIPRQHTPFITIALIILCTAIFLFCLVEHCQQDTIDHFAFIPSHIFGSGLLVSIFLHGGWLHLLGNMYFLWLFGDNVEDRLGWGRYIGFYLGAGILANLFYTLFNPHSQIPLVGASGAIAGIMGAYIVFYPSAKIKTLIFYRILNIPAYIYFGIWIGTQILYGIIDTSGGLSGVAWLAHIGGFMFGIVFAILYKHFSVRHEPA